MGPPGPCGDSVFSPRVRWSHWRALSEERHDPTKVQGSRWLRGDQTGEGGKNHRAVGGCREGPGRALKPTGAALLSPVSIHQLLRKRHIGNDIVTIIFQEPGALPFTPKNIRSHFQHVFIIVRAHNPCTDNVCYRYAPPTWAPGNSPGTAPNPCTHRKSQQPIPSLQAACRKTASREQPPRWAGSCVAFWEALSSHSRAFQESDPQRERGMSPQC